MGYSTPRTTPTVIQTARGLIDGRPFGIYSVKEFGAVGDGTTDDRPAIQAALDAAHAAGGGTVYLPKGVYAIATKNGVSDKHALTVYSNTSLIGAGVGSTIIVAHDTLPSDTPLLRMTEVSDVEVAHLTIDGNKARLGDAHTWKTEDEGIDTKGLCHRLYFHHLVVKNCGQDGMDFDFTGNRDDDLAVRDSRIDNVWFLNNAGSGIHNCGPRMAVTRCYFEGNGYERDAAGGGSIAAVDIEHDGVRLDSCWFVNNVRDVIVKRGRGVRIINTYHRGPRGIRVLAELGEVSDLIIAGINLVQTSKPAAYEAVVGSVLSSTYRGIHIRDSYIESLGGATSSEPAVDLGFPGSTVTGSTIVGGWNNVAFRRADFILAHSQLRNATDTSVDTFGANGGVITGNVMSGAGVRNLHLKSGGGTVITGNHIPNGIANPAGNFFENNVGTLTKAMGKATIPAGQESVSVPHGLYTTPDSVVVSPRGDVNVYVSATSSDNFTLKRSGDTTGELVVDWTAAVLD